ncbi:hypothetical protein D3C75_824120 [compost metagenome]
MIELLAPQEVGAGTQHRLDLAVQGDDRRDGAVALDQDAQRLRIQLQLATRLDRALGPLAPLGGTTGQPDAGQQTGEDQQDDQDDPGARGLQGDGPLGGRRRLKVHCRPASLRNSRASSASQSRKARSAASSSLRSGMTR